MSKMTYDAEGMVRMMALGWTLCSDSAKHQIRLECGEDFARTLDSIAAIFAPEYSGAQQDPTG